MAGYQRESVERVGQFIGNHQRPIDLAVPQVPLEVLQHFFQVGAQFRVSLRPERRRHQPGAPQAAGKRFGLSRLTSPTIAPLSQITASATGREKSSRRRSWNRPSTRWSANGLSKSSRCSGRLLGLTSCCKSGSKYSTGTGAPRCPSWSARLREPTEVQAV
jgi:hypothetical protein